MGRRKHEEGSRAALDSPKQVGAATRVNVSAAPISGPCAPVLELADGRGLQPRAHSGRPGSIPGWGTTFTPVGNLRDNTTKRCPRNKNRSVERVNAAPKRKGSSLKATRKPQSPSSSRSRPANSGLQSIARVLKVGFNRYLLPQFLRWEGFRVQAHAVFGGLSVRCQ